VLEVVDHVRYLGPCPCDQLRRGAVGADNRVRRRGVPTEAAGNLNASGGAVL
jgi:hypothetical protein